MDRWHGAVCGLRKFLKGWGSNRRGEYKTKTHSLMQRIQELDPTSEGVIDQTILARDRVQIEQELETDE